MLNCLFCASSLVAVVFAHAGHEQKPIAGPHKSLWYNTYNSLPGDGGTQVSHSQSLQLIYLADSSQADSVFSGISTFGRLPYWPCLASDEEKYDIAFLGELQPSPQGLRRKLTLVVGAPFDTGTSYRPGARFGPTGIRQGSRRLNL